jgi:hypothetical protein
MNLDWPAAGQKFNVFNETGPVFRTALLKEHSRTCSCTYYMDIINNKGMDCVQWLELAAFLYDRIPSMSLVWHGTNGNNTHDADHLSISYIPHFPHHFESIEGITFCSVNSPCKSNMQDLVEQMCTLCTYRICQRNVFPKCTLNSLGSYESRELI